MPRRAAARERVRDGEMGGIRRSKQINDSKTGDESQYRARENISCWWGSCLKGAGPDVDGSGGGERRGLRGRWKTRLHVTGPTSVPITCSSLDVQATTANANIIEFWG